MATSNPSIVGRTITGIRRLNDEECEQIWGMPASMYDNWLLSWMMAVNSFHLQILKSVGALFYFNPEGEGETLIPPQDE